MTEALLLALLLHPATRPDTTALQAEIQGLYDEISDATLQFATEADVDLFHAVLFAPDWTFIDQSGTVRDWTQMRTLAIQALSAPRPEAIAQSIQKLTEEPDGVTVVVSMSVVSSLVDREGRYGKRDAMHELTETTTFRDRWVRAGDAWKVKSRQQTGRPIVSVDKSE
jgi:hypothetical protein